MEIPKIKKIRKKINKEKLYNSALDKFGAEHQIDMLIEECSELIQALIHHKRGRNTLNDVAKEIADVLIMIEQIEKIKKLEQETEEQKYIKLQRLYNKLEVD